MYRAGRRHQSTKSGFTSKSVAAKARADALETLTRAPKVAKRSKALSATMDDWYAARCEGTKPLRRSTQHDYRRYLEYVRESVGGTPRRDVDAMTLDEFVR